MRIGIDYTAALNQGAGIGRYTRQLVQALLALDTRDEVVLIAAGGAQAGGALSAAGPWRAVSLPFSERVMTILWHRLHLPLWLELFAGKLDVFHSPDFALPPVRQARTVLTVHDLSFMRVPECSQPSLRAYLLRVVPPSVRRADVVLADSESTRNDVIELLGASPDRVRVVYPGVDACFRRVEDDRVLADVRRRYRLPEHFVLGV